MPPPCPGDAVTLTVSSDPRCLGAVRAMVESSAGRAGFDARARHRIALAVDEACANVIRHAYCGRTDGDVTITCSLEPGDECPTFVVHVVDHGDPPPGGCIEPLPVTSPPQPGGLGLRLMHEIMDRVTYARDPEGANVLVLTVACPRGAP